jgi:hypothetical protein
MSFFVFANFFNYLDRGIIPGAASEFDGTRRDYLARVFFLRLNSF